MQKKEYVIKAQGEYDLLLSDLTEIIETSRKLATNSINKIMVDTYEKAGLNFPEINHDTLYNPQTLKFLGLKDDFEGRSLKECYLKALEDFFLAEGTGFAVVSKQKKIEIKNKKHQIDLVLFNRRLKCLVIIDLKLDKITHADIGQMLLYTNYANEHWRIEDENPSVGLILCAEKNDALAHYTLESLPNEVLAKEYKTVLPDEKVLVEEIEKTRKILSGRKIANRKSKIAN